MGFGGATIGTVSVDVVQTDVQAIVDGIAGGHSLADISTQLQTLNFNLSDPWAGSSIYNRLDHLCQSVDSLYYCLRNDNMNQSAIDCLLSMEYYLAQIAGDPYPGYH